MSTIFRGIHPSRNLGHGAIGPGTQSGAAIINIDTFADRGQQLQPTEGVPTSAQDPNKWNLPITSLAVTDAPWKPVFPDYIFRPFRTALLVMALSAPDRQPEPPPLSWKPVYPDIVRRPLATPWRYQFIAIPTAQRILDRAVAIHVADEIPIGEQFTINVEYDVAGVPLPFDVPPSLRVYHLDAAGAQVTDLALGVCTQYGANPSYFRNWTPTAKGVFMVELIGVFMGAAVLEVQPLTVRAKIDPIGMSINPNTPLIFRNGDVP